MIKTEHSICLHYLTWACQLGGLASPLVCLQFEGTLKRCFDVAGGINIISIKDIRDSLKNQIYIGHIGKDKLKRAGHWTLKQDSRSSYLGVE